MCIYIYIYIDMHIHTFDVEGSRIMIFFVGGGESTKQGLGYIVSLGVGTPVHTQKTTLVLRHVSLHPMRSAYYSFRRRPRPPDVEIAP